jgi:hypothetical protein
MPHLVAHRVTRSKDQQRDVFIPLADLSQRIGPAQSGQHQIENDQVVIIRPRHFQPSGAVSRDIYRVPFRSEALDNES